MRLKVLTWNIWVDGNFGRITEFLRAADADILGLEEVQADDAQRDVIGYLRELGYRCVHAPVQTVWNGRAWNDGPAIFSKYDIESFGNVLWPFILDSFSSSTAETTLPSFR